MGGINVSSRTTRVAEGFSLPNPHDLEVMVLWRPKGLRYMARAYWESTIIELKNDRIMLTT